MNPLRAPASRNPMTLLTALAALFGVVVGFGFAAVEFGGLAIAAWKALPRRPPARPPRPVESPRRLRLLARADAVRCPVCAGAVDGAVVVCPRCRVLSHEDCWSYAGGCAIFACEPR